MAPGLHAHPVTVPDVDELARPFRRPAVGRAPFLRGSGRAVQDRRQIELALEIRIRHRREEAAGSALAPAPPPALLALLDRPLQRETLAADEAALEARLRAGATPGTGG